MPPPSSFGRPPRRAIVFAAAMVLGVGASRHAEAAEAVVTIDNFVFTPARITVAPGTRVTWINRDDIPHVVADAKHPHAMKSPPLDTGDRFSFVYSRSGTYPYFCLLHPHMQGTVIVR